MYLAIKAMFQARWCVTKRGVDPVGSTIIVHVLFQHNDTIVLPVGDPSLTCALCL